MPKLPPIYDGRFVLRPEQDTSYVHFENAAAHPFQPDPVSFPRVNVWWLAEAALLSYWDPDAAIARFNAAGLEAEFVKAGGTECYVIWQSDLACRGLSRDRGGSVEGHPDRCRVRPDSVAGKSCARRLRPGSTGDRAKAHTGDQPSGGRADPLVLRP